MTGLCLEFKWIGCRRDLILLIISTLISYMGICKAVCRKRKVRGLPWRRIVSG